MLRKIREALQNIKDQEVSQSPIINLLFTAIAVVVTITFYVGQYSQELAGSFYEAEFRMGKIEQELKELNTTIERQTEDRYTNKEATIHNEKYEDAIAEIRKRLKMIEEKCLEGR